MSYCLLPWSYTRPVTSCDKLMVTLLQVSTKSYTWPAISHNQLIVTSLQVSKEADVYTQGMSLVSDSIQLIKGAWWCYTTLQQVEICKWIRPLNYAYASKLLTHTKDDVPPKPVASCGTKPTTGDKLWTKRSPLGNLGVVCCMKLVLRFSGTRAGRSVELPRVIYCSLWRSWYKVHTRVPPANPQPTLQLPSKAGPVCHTVDQQSQSVKSDRKPDDGWLVIFHYVSPYSQSLKSMRLSLWRYLEVTRS